MKRVKRCYRCGCLFVCSMEFSQYCPDKSNCFDVGCRVSRANQKWFSGEDCDIRIIKRGRN